MVAGPVTDQSTEPVSARTSRRCPSAAASRSRGEAVVARGKAVAGLTSSSRSSARPSAMDRDSAPSRPDSGRVAAPTVVRNTELRERTVGCNTEVRDGKLRGKLSHLSVAQFSELECVRNIGKCEAGVESGRTCHCAFFIEFC
jgi:hypothetical protein